MDLFAENGHSATNLVFHVLRHQRVDEVKIKTYV